MTATSTVPVEQTILDYQVPSVAGEFCTSCGSDVTKAAHVAVMVDKPSVYVFFCGSHARDLSENLAAKGWAMHPAAPRYILK